MHSFLKVLGSTVVVTFLGACQPCEADADCAEMNFCGEQGFCTQDCVIIAHCTEADQACSDRGQCIQALAPSIAFLSPDPGTTVDGLFDVEVEVSWVGELLNLRIERDPLNAGNICAPFIPAQLSLLGDPQRETTQRVLISGLQSFGTGAVRLRAAASIREGNERYAVLALESEIPEGTLVGADVIDPDEGLLANNPPISVPLEVILPNVADRVWAFSETISGGVTTPRRSVGFSTMELIDLRLPIARGAQFLQLDVENGATSKRCSIGLTTPPAIFSRLEVALFFQGSEPSDLDLWVFSQPDGAEPASCNVLSPRDICQEPHTTNGVRRWGEEAVQLDVVDGIFGLAVAPAAVSEPVTATLRVSRGDNHLAWLGPFTLVPTQGSVWLAARIYVVGGSVTVEPLDLLNDGLPGEYPGAW